MIRIAEVAVRISARQLNQPFTYVIPKHFPPASLIGKRVKIPLQRQVTEGYVLRDEILKDTDATDYKEILEVLDQEPVLSPGLIALGRWMADFYAAPLKECLDLMVPSLLSQAKEIMVSLAPGFSAEEISFTAGQQRFLNQLAEKKRLTWQECLAWLTEAELFELEQKAVITRTYQYRISRISKEEYGYTAAGDEASLPPQAKKQREALAYVTKQQYVSHENLAAKFKPEVIKSLIAKGLLSLEPLPSRIVEPEYLLNEEQLSAIRFLEEKIDAQRFFQGLLYGVTGSGKTEVYIGAIRHCLDKGRNSLILVPEIALAQQMIRQLKTRLPQVTVLHSQMSSGERYREWKRIKEGQVRVVVGARSAVFAPLESLGLIILDEEQEGSYKNEERPRYHTLEVARQRAEREQAVLFLGSATPRLQTIDQVLKGKLPMLLLQKKVSAFLQLRVELEDKRPLTESLGPLTKKAIAETLSRQEQVVLFINRRGYAPRTICRSCGKAQLCPHCAVALTYHADVKKNLCHYCNYSVYSIERCEYCQSRYLAVTGSGTQKIEEEIRSLYPSARVARLDLDSGRKKKYYQELLSAMRSGEIDILIGTQMVAKGLDFPKVSLVGILDADALFALPDYRADERAFQLMMQAAGRAGRADKPGRVIVQTYRPEDPLWQLLVRQEYWEFALKTLAQRKELGYPPFTHICRLLLSGTDEPVVRQTAEELQQLILELLDARENGFSLLGPAPAPIAKLRDRYRYQLLLKSVSREFLVSVVNWRLLAKLEPSVRIEHDFDPTHTM